MSSYGRDLNRDCAVCSKLEDLAGFEIEGEMLQRSLVRAHKCLGVARPTVRQLYGLILEEQEAPVHESGAGSRPSILSPSSLIAATAAYHDERSRRWFTRGDRWATADSADTQPSWPVEGGDEGDSCGSRRVTDDVEEEAVVTSQPIIRPHSSRTAGTWGSRPASCGGHTSVPLLNLRGTVSSSFPFHAIVRL